MSHSVFLKPDENGNWGKVGSDATGNMSEELVFQNGATALGNGTVQDVGGYSVLMIRVTISATATVSFETSVDGTNYNAITGMVGSTATGSNTSVTNDYRFNIGGVKWFRARISSYTSGTVDVVGYASSSGLIVTSGSIQSYGSGDTNSTTLNLQGVGAYNLLFDGTNWTRQRAANNAPDGNNGGFVSANGLFAFNGTSWDRVRAGKVYKYIEYLSLANATATTVWTPASTKKFRLMGVSISCGSTGNKFHLRAGTAGSGTAFYTFRSTGSAGDTQSFYFGNGYLATNVNDVLEIYNATGVTADVWVTAWGTEE